MRSKGFDFLGGRRGCPRGDPAVQFVDVTVDECGVGSVEALGESCEGAGGDLQQIGFLADDGEQGVLGLEVAVGQPSSAAAARPKCRCSATAAKYPTSRRSRSTTRDAESV
jgi:hypothetical protein